MIIDQAHFTPFAALTGGLIIGVAATMFALLNGRIAGISGIVGGLLRRTRGEMVWRIAFVAGLIAAPWFFRVIAPLPEVRINAGTGTLLLAGFLVGIGTRYGAGCTSGHGICGLSRLSPRSAVAVCSFMVAGIATVFLFRHFFQ